MKFPGYRADYGSDRRHVRRAGPRPVKNWRGAEAHAIIVRFGGPVATGRPGKRGVAFGLQHPARQRSRQRMAAKTLPSRKEGSRAHRASAPRRAREDYMNDAHSRFSRSACSSCATSYAERRRHRRHLRENEITTTRRPRNARRGYTLELRTATASATLRGREVDTPDRRRQHGGARRTGEPIGVPACSLADGNALARSPGAARARAEAVRTDGETRRPRRAKRRCLWQRREDSGIEQAVARAKRVARTARRTPALPATLGGS